MRYLAIDIGASSGRHIVAEMRGGKLALEEVYRFPNGPVRTADGLVWDFDGLYAHVLEGLKKAGELGKRPDCVGIDTWAVDYALLGKSGEIVGPVYCYRDGRGGKAAAKLHEKLPFAELYARTGIQYQPFNTVYQLYADKLAGRLDKATAMVMLPDLLHYGLTGARVQEYTNATSTGMVNAVTRDWDGDILEAAGIPRSLLGDIVQPGCEVGRFSGDVKAYVGYDAAVMLPATHDTASAVLAAPVESGSPYISSGTWSLLGCEQPYAHTDAAAMAGNWSNEGSVNGEFRLQKNIMGLWVIQQVRHELGDRYSFAQLAEMARAHPTDRRIDINGKRYLAPKSMLDEIFSEAGNMAAGETAYCVFASLADCYAASVRELEALTEKKYPAINVIGGGANNRLLCELTAAATGKRIVVGPAEGTATGNVIMQMIGTGELTDIAAARAVVKDSFDITEV